MLPEGTAELMETTPLMRLLPDNESRVLVKSELAILALLAVTRMSTYPSGRESTPSINTLFIDENGEKGATIDHFWHERSMPTWFFYNKVNRAAAVRLRQKGEVELEHRYPDVHKCAYKISAKGLERLLRKLPRI